jgi:phage-related protein
MDDYSLPSSLLPSHLLIAPLGVDCKFAVPYNNNNNNNKKESLNKHMCCVLQGDCRTRQNKCGVFPAAATLPELL